MEKSGSNLKRPYCEVSLEPGNPKRRHVEVELNQDPVVAEEDCSVQFPDEALDGTKSLAHPEVVCVSDDNEDDPERHERFSPELIERGCRRDYGLMTVGGSKSGSHPASPVDTDPALFPVYGFLGHKEPLPGVLSDDAWDSEILGQEISAETEDEAAENLPLGDTVQDQNVVCITDDEDVEEGGAAPETERCSRSSNPLYLAQVVRTFPPGCGSRASRMLEIEPWEIDLQDDYFSDSEDENVVYNTDGEDGEDTGAAPKTERCSRSSNRAKAVRTFPPGCGSRASRMPEIEPWEIELQDDDYFSDDGRRVYFSDDSYDDSCSDFSDDDCNEFSSDDDDTANN